MTKGCDRDAGSDSGNTSTAVVCNDLRGSDEAGFSPVVPEVVLSSEGLVADITRVRPLICMRPLVDQKVVGFGKMSATELADKFLLGLGGQSASAGLALG